MSDSALERIARVGGEIVVRASFPTRDALDASFPARCILSNFAIFENSFSLSEGHRKDPKVRNGMLHFLKGAADTVLADAAADTQDFWVSYGVGVLWLYLNDPEQAESNGTMILDELVSSGKATVAAIWQDDAVKLGVVPSRTQAPALLH